MTGAGPRLLAILGSGETAPTMVTTHREIVARFGGRRPRAVLLDTPYGFQENAAEISKRAVDYFARSVQLPIEIAGYPGPLAADPSACTPAAQAAALARLRAADLIFSGPGSPSYALSVWRGSPVPEAIIARLTQGGALVFSSAAVVTLGRLSLPVYEVYKVGQAPRWLGGLDLLGAAGLPGTAAVIPHYDNAEGGTHDTRFCYMGERRLAMLEALLPADGWVLGVDEHTALVLDLDTGGAVVTGRGAVTVRRRGTSRRFPEGQLLSMTELAAAASGDATGDSPVADPASRPGREAAGASEPDRRRVPGTDASLLGEVSRLELAFAAALGTRRAAGAVEAILELDRTILDWSADTLQSDEPDRARAILYSLVHRLGEAAEAGLRDPRDVLAPLVDRLIALRAELRAGRAWELADRLRDRMIAAGIELKDTPAGTTWQLRP